ncbi:MAG: ribosome biogenesis GTPase Der [Deltaproteobacteria bacterium]|nr:ribosome biogenesis GTPase Der [Deltaproteobacteria bacterium]
MAQNKRKPIIAIAGRPNVGKSTLFNRLSRKWSSIVEDRPGITRDRLYFETDIQNHPIILIDTGGLQFSAASEIERKMSEQAWRGVEEADVILFVMDGRAGVTPLDKEWAKRLRRIKKPVLAIVNKIDDPNLESLVAPFYEIGLKDFIVISAEKQRNFSGLQNRIIDLLKGQDLLADQEEEEPSDISVAESPEPSPEFDQDDAESDSESEEQVASSPVRVSTDPLNIAIVGRPNVGKSTLLNAILEDDRCLVDNNPGTTRDPIHTFFEYKDQTYKFIDTAGIRKRAKTIMRVEKMSTVQSLKIIDDADIVLLVFDSEIGPTEQDAHVAGYAFEKNKAMILLANKWDLGKEKYTKEYFEGRMELKMNFLQHFPLLYISAKTGRNIKKIFDVIDTIQRQYHRVIKTSELNRAFEQIVTHHPLPVYKGQQIKMYYATQVSSRPPTFLVFCNYPNNVHFSYKRYVSNALREMFDLQDIPVNVIFKGR